ncbi:MAG: HAMP domain-containing sensor histidine kinase [Bacteroidota bacterium]
MKEQSVTNDFATQYRQELEQKTMRVGIPSAFIGILGSAAFYYLDQVDLDLEHTLFWRGLGVAGGVFFLLIWLIKPWHRFVIPVHALSMMCYLIMMSGIGYLIFTNPAMTQKHYFAITSGFLTVWFIISLIAQGARRILMYAGAVLVVVTTVLYAMNSASITDNAGYIFSIFMVGVFAVLNMRSRARYDYDQAFSMYRLEKSRNQIRQQAADLQDKNDNLVMFSRAMSHDLQGPLRRVRSFLDLYEFRSKDQLPEMTQEYLDLARQHLEQGQKVVHDLLIYSKIGQNGLAKRDVNVDQLCQKVEEEQLPLQEAAAPIVIDRQIEANIKADEKLLWYLLTNLMSNAIKFSSKQDDPNVKIRCLANGTEVILSVADNGVGFDESFLEELGHPFKRFHGTEYAGTGIGLSIVSQIVKMHNGRFWAESPPGKGATFFCAFPK